MIRSPDRHDACAWPSATSVPALAPRCRPDAFGAVFRRRCRRPGPTSSTPVPGAGIDAVGRPPVAGSGVLRCRATMAVRRVVPPIARVPAAAGGPGGGGGPGRVQRPRPGRPLGRRRAHRRDPGAVHPRHLTGDRHPASAGAHRRLLRGVRGGGPGEPPLGGRVPRRHRRALGLRDRGRRAAAVAGRLRRPPRRGHPGRARGRGPGRRPDARRGRGQRHHPGDGRWRRGPLRGPARRHRDRLRGALPELRGRRRGQRSCPG